MPITAFLDLRVRPDALDGLPAELAAVLADSRAWRAAGGATNLGSFLVAPPTLTKFSAADDI